METIKKRFDLTHPSGKTLPVDVEYDRISIRFNLFGIISVSPGIEKGKKAIHASYLSKEGKKLIEDFFLTKINGDGVFISITDASYDALCDVMASRKELHDEYEALKLKLSTEADKFYQLYDFLDYGDYKIEQSRYVYTMRKGIAELAEDVEQNYLFASESILLCSPEQVAAWNSCIELNGGEPQNGKRTNPVGKDIVDKIVAVSNINKEAERAKQAEIEKAKQQKIDIKKEEERKKFAEAKLTGKSVLLSQHFIHEDQLPKHLREDESDMVTVCIWAEPDGTTKETYTHSY